MPKKTIAYSGARRFSSSLTTSPLDQYDFSPIAEQLCQVQRHDQPGARIFKALITITTQIVSGTPYSSRQVRNLTYAPNLEQIPTSKCKVWVGAQGWSKVGQA